MWSEAFTRYAIVIEQGPASFGAYVPDLPGCVAAAESREEVVKLIHEAIGEHIQMLREEGLAVPEPHCAVKKQWRLSLSMNRRVPPT